MCIRDSAGSGAAFAGYVRVGVFGKNGVEHGVGDLVAYFVGMALGDGFRRKQSPHGILDVYKRQEY